MSMTDRERDFENRYAHDQELRFRIEARRNKLLGLWAAEKLGKAGEEANAYAQEVIKADFLLPGDDDVFQLDARPSLTQLAVQDDRIRWIDALVIIL